MPLHVLLHDGADEADAVACDEQFVGLVATKDCKYAAASFQALNVPRVVNHPLQDLVHPIQWRQAADHHIGWHS